MINIDDFKKIDMRVGTIISVEEFTKARNPSYKLRIDFGGFGIKKSSAQITDHYSPGDLINRQVVAVVNFPEKIIADYSSEVLVLGANGKNKDIILLGLDRPMENGAKIS